MDSIIVVDQLKEWNFDVDGVEVVRALADVEDARASVGRAEPLTGQVVAHEASLAGWITRRKSTPGRLTWPRRSGRSQSGWRSHRGSRE